MVVARVKLLRHEKGGRIEGWPPLLAPFLCDDVEQSRGQLPSERRRVSLPSAALKNKYLVLNNAVGIVHPIVDKPMLAGVLDDIAKIWFHAFPLWLGLLTKVAFVSKEMLGSFARKCIEHCLPVFKPLVAAQ